MPPKPKFDREDIVSAAFELLRIYGPEGVTARAVGEKLGCSSRPIFTFFERMEELQAAANEKAMALYRDYLRAADDYVPAFKMRGMQMFRFAKEEPQLFRALFMSEQTTLSGPELLQKRIVGFETDLLLLMERYQLTREEALRVFTQLWLTDYGLCVLVASGACDFSETELVTILGNAFQGAVFAQKEDHREAAMRLPVRKDEMGSDAVNGAIPRGFGENRGEGFGRN